jgi:peptide chain release factor 1
MEWNDRLVAKVEAVIRRFEELERMMSDPDVLTNSARMAAVAREHGSLAKLATKYRRLKGMNQK